MATQLRKKRAPNTDASLLVIKTDEGYRVRLPFDPAKSYVVTIVQGQLHCTCSDFQVKRFDPNYSCRHIAAVIEFDSEKTRQESSDEEHEYAERHEDDLDEEAIDAWREGQAHDRDDAQLASQVEPFHPPNAPYRESGIVTSASRMLIKRSLSPDGRIDSVSIELDFPVDPEQTDEIKSKAASALELQTTIIHEFLNIHPAQAQPTSQKEDGKGLKSVPKKQEPVCRQALLKDIGSTESKWGTRFFINVEVAGRVLKLFGTEKQLSAHIADAGYALPVSKITEGKVLNIPCLVTTKPSSDGRYLNVEQVFEEDRPQKAS